MEHPRLSSGTSGCRSTRWRSAAVNEWLPPGPGSPPWRTDGRKQRIEKGQIGYTRKMLKKQLRSLPFGRCENTHGGH